MAQEGMEWQVEKILGRSTGSKGTTGGWLAKIKTEKVYLAIENTFHKNFVDRKCDNNLGATTLFNEPAAMEM
jgi:hypothetical protein